MDVLQMVLLGLNVFLAFCNACIMIYVFLKFINKPHDTLEARVLAVEVKTKEHDKALKDIDEKFKEQDETNTVFKKVMLLFANFEVAFCLHTDYKDTSDLMEAKKELNNYLSK